MSDLNALYRAATTHHQHGRLGQAEKKYRQIPKRFPRHADALHLLGLVCSQSARHEEAVSLLKRAVELQPNSAPFINNYAEVLRKGGQLEQAEQQFQKAIALQNSFPVAWYNLGNTLKVQGKYQAAISAYQNCLAQQPDYFQAAYNLGNCYLDINAFVSARDTYLQAMRLKPDDVDLLNNLGSAHHMLDEYDKARECFETVLKFRPDSLDGLKNIAGLAEDLGDYDAGCSYLERVIALSDDPVQERLSLLLKVSRIAESNEQIETYQKKVSDSLDGFADDLRRGFETDITKIGTEPPITWAYQGRGVLGLKQQIAGLYAPLLPELEATGSGQERLRIGFVVTRGHEGVFIKCMRGILNHIDCERFQVAVVCSHGGQQIIKSRLENDKVNFLVLDKSFPRAVEKVRQARFDVLHYWEVGTDSVNYFLPFYRLAPVQCTSWGWPVTSGIPNMDYYLSCALIEPENAETHYSERLVLLEHLPTYYYRPPVPVQDNSRSSYGLPESGAIYLCSQNLRKVHPDFDALVTGILTRDKEGCVAMISSKHKHETALLQRRMKQAMPDVYARIHFLPQMEEPLYLALVKLATVVLDTPHYGGGANTCYDAFAAGTPLVTLAGGYHSGRYALGACRWLGLEELVARDSTEYADIAVRLGCDGGYRESIGEEILDRSASLFEDIKPVRELEAFFVTHCGIARSNSG